MTPSQRHLTVYARPFAVQVPELALIDNTLYGVIADAEGMVCHNPYL